MFEKTQKAANELAGAVAEDANKALAVAKAAVVPAVSGFFGTIAGYANKLKEGVEDGSLFRQATETAEAPAAKPDVSAIGLSEDKIAAIKSILAVNPTLPDAAVAAIVNVESSVVSLFRNATA